MSVELKKGSEMINAEQIRAARGLLDWSTADLAKQTGLTINGINKIERGHVQAHQETIHKLQEVFEIAGIEFLPGSGLRKKDRIVQTHEGEGANHALLNDVYETLRDVGGEVLISGVIEKLAIEDLSESFLKDHINKLNKAGITERMLIRKGDIDFTVPSECYRWVAPEYFSPYSMYIYGPKLGLVSWAPRRRSVIIHDEGFAESTRRLFNFVWDLSEPPIVTTSKSQR
jgi:transcriptional regulator with XRE-family HTH domain